MKVKVHYSGGPSRYSGQAVDYMLAEIRGVELYAEAPADPADETATYDTLKAEILRQAEAAEIPADNLIFYYD